MFTLNTLTLDTLYYCSVCALGEKKYDKKYVTTNASRPRRNRSNKTTMMTTCASCTQYYTERLQTRWRGHVIHFFGFWFTVSSGTTLLHRMSVNIVWFRITCLRDRCRWWKPELWLRPCWLVIVWNLGQQKE